MHATVSHDFERHQSAIGGFLDLVRMFHDNGYLLVADIDNDEVAAFESALSQSCVFCEHISEAVDRQLIARLGERLMVFLDGLRAAINAGAMMPAPADLKDGFMDSLGIARTAANQMRLASHN